MSSHTLPIDSQLFINGELRPAEGNKTYHNIGPWTGKPIGTAADASANDVNDAIAAARNAFDNSDWSTNHTLRESLIHKLYELFVAHKARLGHIAQHEAGAALGTVSRAHVDMALNSWKTLMTVYPKLQREKDYGINRDFGFPCQRKAHYEAIGVVAAITPWNVPLYVNAEKVVSALLAGCTVVLKPAPDTPAMGVIFGELAQQAGFPPGVINVVTGSDPVMAGEMLVKDERVDLITFTGSSGVGKTIMATGAPTLKRVFLELGGKSAKIILDDAPNFAQDVAQSMLVFHAGQGCAVLSRLLVPQSRYAEAVEILRASYSAYKDQWGHFDEPNCLMGPVISEKQMHRVKSYIDIGVEEGATLIAGGHLRPDMGDGWFVEPTCFVDVTPEMRIAREEIFGPVLVVIPYQDEADAIAIANDSEYGLSGGISTGDLQRGLNIANQIRTGTIGINGGSPICGDLPFGGYKVSGIGRAWGVEGIEEFLETKIVAYPVSA